MWCRHCQQDVPGILSDDTGKYRCPRCEEVLFSPMMDLEQTMPVLGQDMPVLPPPKPQSRLLEPLGPSVSPPMDNWELDEQLRHIGRILATETKEEQVPELPRVDPAHDRPEGPRHQVLHKPRLGERIETWQSRVVLPLLMWGATLVGTMSVVCGGMLLLCSSLADRPELWGLGLPIALGGAASLGVGLMLKIDRVWQRRRVTTGPVPAPAGRLRDPASTARTL